VARDLLQQLQQRRHRKRQKFLWEGCSVAVPGTFALVYANQLTTETYAKIIVLANGEVHCNINLPTLLWLGQQHVQGELKLLDDIDLMVFHNADASQPENAWWNVLRAQFKCLRDNVIYGDIVFARKGDDLAWDKQTFMATVARGLAHAE